VVRAVLEALEKEQDIIFDPAGPISEPQLANLCFALKDYATVEIKRFPLQDEEKHAV
jgi:hypothetical protein